MKPNNCFNLDTNEWEHNLCVRNDGKGFYEMCYRCNTIFNTPENDVKRIWDIK